MLLGLSSPIANARSRFSRMSHVVMANAPSATVAAFMGHAEVIIYAGIVFYVGVYIYAWDCCSVVDQREGYYGEERGY